MIELGKRQTLTITKKVDFGVYLSDKNDPNADATERILLPKKQVPEDADIDKDVEVFVYRDSSDRLIATTTMPKIMLGEFALLEVYEVSKIGAFLNWGLEKDLLLPYKEQTKPVKAGDKCLVALYTDKSNRLCATMKVYEYLRKDSPYKKDDMVNGLVYEISRNFGAFVAVDDMYSGLISVKQLYGEQKISVGDRITARVTAVKEDGKLDLAVREKAYLQLDIDGEKLIQMMQQQNGELPFTDKADPELIKEATGMSKNEFKRAIGHLLKNKKIEITDKKICLK